jgi:hypothetical protein
MKIKSFFTTTLILINLGFVLQAKTGKPIVTDQPVYSL